MDANYEVLLYKKKKKTDNIQWHPNKDFVDFWNGREIIGCFHSCYHKSPDFTVFLDNFCKNYPNTKDDQLFIVVQQKVQKLP